MKYMDDSEEEEVGGQCEENHWEKVGKGQEEGQG